jgi:hypothetical protein
MEESTLYTYGMRLRGFSIGCQPMDGYIAHDDDILNEYYSILLYNRKLTNDECCNYDLDYLGKRRLKK